MASPTKPVDVAAQSDFLKKALGAHAHEQFIADKSGEVDKFSLHVSEFDLEEHLKLWFWLGPPAIIR